MKNILKTKKAKQNLKKKKQTTKTKPKTQTQKQFGCSIRSQLNKKKTIFSIFNTFTVKGIER